MSEENSKKVKELADLYSLASKVENVFLLSRKIVMPQSMKEEVEKYLPQIEKIKSSFLEAIINPTTASWDQIEELKKQFEGAEEL